MKISLLILFAFVAMASADTLRYTSEMQWHQFKATFNKNYGTGQYEMMRRTIFEENLRKIQTHNYQADLGVHRFRLGINQFSDLSNAEYRKVMLGLRRNRTRSSSGSAFLAPHNVKMPAEVDWRKHGYVTKVKNQKQCGSCWAFSTTGSLEGQHARKTGKLVSLSEQQLVDCSRGYGNHGCEGGLMDQGFEYIKAKGGIDTESFYPYEAKDEKCHFSLKHVGATVTGFVDVPHNEEALKVAVATIGPISVGIDASMSSFQNYKSGVYNEPECDSDSLDHGVLVVGYGRTTGEKAEDFWIVKNSWGPSWGLNGYILMRRNANNMCGIATIPSYPLV